MGCGASKSPLTPEQQELIDRRRMLGEIFDECDEFDGIKDTLSTSDYVLEFVRRRCSKEVKVLIGDESHTGDVLTRDEFVTSHLLKYEDLEWSLFKQAHAELMVKPEPLPHYMSSTQLSKKHLSSSKVLRQNSLIIDRARSGTMPPDRQPTSPALGSLARQATSPALGSLARQATSPALAKAKTLSAFSTPVRQASASE